MTFWAGLKFSYRESWAFMLACPLLALVPVAGEMLQHVIEMNIGMYDSMEGAKAADDNQLRMIFGFVKTIGIMLPGYWIVRFLAGGRDASAARRIDPTAVRLFAYVLLFQMVLTAFQLFGLPRTGTAVLIGLAASLLLNPLLIRWAAAAPLGIFISPLESARVMAGQLPWLIAFSVVVILPVMIPHYALGAAAIFAPAILKWPILILDSLLVGYLTAVIVASGWVMATRKVPLPVAATTA